MKTIERHDNKAIFRFTGVVVELHTKSSENWSRARLLLDTGNKEWVTGKFGLKLGEVVVCDCVYDAKFKSYDIKALICDSVAVVSNTIICLKLVEGLDGVGKVKAQRLSEKYPNLFQAITEVPDEVAAYVGIPVTAVLAVAEDLTREKNNLNRLTALEKAGWPNALAKKAIKNDKIFKVASESPYKAIKLIEGLGWKTADEIGYRQGIKKDDPARVEAAVEYYYADFVADDGHTKVELNELINECSGILGLPSYEGVKHVVPAANNTLIGLGDNWYCTDAHYKNTNTIAEFFLGRLVNKKYVEKNDGPNEPTEELDSGSDFLEE